MDPAGVQKVLPNNLLEDSVTGPPTSQGCYEQASGMHCILKIFTRKECVSNPNNYTDKTLSVPVKGTGSVNFHESRSQGFNASSILRLLLIALEAGA